MRGGGIVTAIIVLAAVATIYDVTVRHRRARRRKPHGGLKGSIEAHAKLVPPRPTEWIRELWQRLQGSVAFLLIKIAAVVLLALIAWVLVLGLMIEVLGWTPPFMGERMP